MIWTTDQGASDQDIKMKFHATGGISRHGDLMEHEGFSLIFKVVPVSVQFNIQSHGL